MAGEVSLGTSFRTFEEQDKILINLCDDQEKPYAIIEYSR